MNWRAAGLRGALLECEDGAQVQALYALLRDTLDAQARIEDLVPAARTLLLIGRDAHRWAKWACQQSLVGRARTSRELIEIEVRYDGADLEVVAQHAGLSVAQVIQAHSQAQWTVAFCGFAPGFAYLTGGPPELQVPRHATPRKQVPAGAVGLAGEFTGIYPRSSPGGWQLIGRTDAVLWNLQRQSPALLQPGQAVRFRVQP